jgi:hypothetical protein
MMCEGFICLLSMPHMKESGALLEDGEIHNATCENNCVLDFFVELLEDPNPYHIIIQS